MSKLIVGNWKMKIGTRESIALARGVLLALRGKRVVPDLVLCPPFVALGDVHKVVARSRVGLGAQNMFWEDEGAFTGEISPRMLTELGVTHVIVGHSERRSHLHETDEMIHAKLEAAVRNKLTAILCVGETADQREGGDAEKIVAAQVRAAVRQVRFGREGLMLAYEPIWAIGTGKAATPADAVAMHTLMRRALAEELDGPTAARTPILYGGSVDGTNAFSFLREPMVGGVLVGGASVKIHQFIEIMNAAIDVIEGESAAR